MEDSPPIESPKQDGPKRGRLSIGVPGFEPGTSPTRTARATRLRHTPKERSVPNGALQSHDGFP